MFLSVFTDCPAAVAQFIQNTQRCIDIAVCWFTHPLIFRSLKNALERGVKVRLVVNYDQINFSPQGLDFQWLAKSGAEVYGFPGPQLMHHKMAVADGAKIITGSFNWTLSDQIDHFVVIESAALTAQFRQAFQAVLEAARPLADLQDIQPARVVFSALHRPVLRSSHDIKKRVIAGAKAWITVFKTQADWYDATFRSYCCLPVKMGIALPETCFDSVPALKNRMASVQLPIKIRQEVTRFCLRAKHGDIVVACTSSGHLLGIGLLGDQQFTVSPGAIFRYAQWISYKKSLDDLDMQAPVDTSFAKFKGSVLEVLAKL